MGFSIALIVFSLLLMLLVLMHKGKGGGLSDMFGGGMQSSVGGSSVAERNLDRITVVVGLLWFACIVVLGLLMKLEQLTVRPADRRRRRPAYHEGWRPTDGSNSGHWTRVGPYVDWGARSGAARSMLRSTMTQGVTTVASGNAIRGSRVGAGPMGEAERGESAPRLRISFWCSNGHETQPSFASDAQVPGHLGLPALWLPGRQGPGQPAGPAAHRAVQDPPRLRPGAAQRRRRRGDPRRGARQAPRRDLTDPTHTAGPARPPPSGRAGRVGAADTCSSGPRQRPVRQRTTVAASASLEWAVPRPRC